MDVLSFGGTKNGMMYGEAVIFFDQNSPPISNTFASKACDLPSKMRFISAQFEASVR